MNTITRDEQENLEFDNPGFQLGLLREKKGFTKEYVAAKLHLRVRLIELLEADDYSQMPQAVFIMGYFRAYAKLLGISPDPYIESFNNLYIQEKKPEKALWQSKRESNRNELIVRLVTVMVAISAMLAIAFWWQKNKDSEFFFTIKAKENEAVVNTGALDSKELLEKKLQGAKLTEISRIQSFFSSQEAPDMKESSGA